jgi:hypothetical protein
MCQNNNQSICAHFPHQTRSASLIDSSPARIQHVPYFSIRITHAGWMPVGYTANCIKALFSSWPCREGNQAQAEPRENRGPAAAAGKGMCCRTNLDAGTDLVAKTQKYTLSNFKVFS